MIYLVLIFSILYFILAKLRPDWAVMLLIAALPSYLIRFTAFGIPMTLLEAMILIAFIVWLINNYKGIIRNLKFKIKNYFPPKADQPRAEKISNHYPFDLEIVLLLIVSFIAVAVAGFSDSGFGIWKAYFFEPVLLLIVIFNVFGKKDNREGVIRMTQIEKILWPLCISALAVSLLAIYQKLTGAFIFNDFWAVAEARRATSFFGYPNAVGLYLGPLVLVFLGWFFYQRKIINNQTPRLTGGQANSKQISIIKNQFINRLIILLITSLSLLAIYYAKSKGALIGVAAGMFVFAVLANKKIRWILIILALVSIVGVSLYQPAREYAKEKIIYNKSLLIRLAGWKDTWAMLNDGRLISGSGLANFQASIVPYHTEGFFYNDGTDPEFHRHVVWNEDYKKKSWQPLEIYLYPHNIILNFWVELGLAGVLLFIWIIGKFWVMGFKIIRNLKFEIRNFDIINKKYLVIGLMCSMVVIFIHGLVDVPYFKNDLAVMFWLLVALMSISSLEIRNKK